MNEIKQENFQGGMYEQPFTLTCSKCGFKWVGRNEAHCNELVKTQVCNCVKEIDAMSQEQLKEMVMNGMIESSPMDEIIEAKPVVTNGPVPLKPVDW